MKKEKLVEVCRSFSYKLNVGNYESRDFFCSQKAEVPEIEAVETSEALYQFCKNEVIKSVNSYKYEASPKEPPKKIEVSAEIISDKEFDKIRQGDEAWEKVSKKEMAEIIDEKERERNQKEFETELKSNPNWKRAKMKRDNNIPLIEDD